MWHPESILDASGHLDEGVVHAWLDGQLAPSAATQVEHHASGCAACSAMVAEARGLVAGASRVMSALDEPVVGQAPPRVAAMVPARSVKPSRWSTRRVSLAAAAALVFVTATLVLRDSDGVRQMIQGDDSVREAATATESAQSIDAPLEATAADQLAPAAPAAPPAPRADVANADVGAGEGTGTSGAGGARLVDRPDAVQSPVASPGGRVGAVGGATTDRGVDAGAAFRGQSAPSVGERSPIAVPPAAVSSPLPAPAPTPAQAPAAQIARGEMVPRGGVAARKAGSPDPVAQGAAVASEAATRARSVRTSGEIQAMVRMVSSCWRIAGSDTVLELLPPGTSLRTPAAPEGKEAWIPGWLRIGRDATNPDRIWWLPLQDSVSARVRSSDELAPDLIITPQTGSASLRRVPRADAAMTIDPDSTEATAETAESVPCASP